MFSLLSTCVWLSSVIHTSLAVVCFPRVSGCRLLFSCVWLSSVIHVCLAVVCYPRVWLSSVFHVCLAVLCYSHESGCRLLFTCAWLPSVFPFESEQHHHRPYRRPLHHHVPQRHLRQQQFVNLEELLDKHSRFSDFGSQFPYISCTNDMLHFSSMFFAKELFKWSNA